MKALLSILKKHPISIFFYLLYTVFYGRMVWVVHLYSQSKGLNHGERLMWGEGIMYGYLFSFIIATAFIIIMLFNALLRETGKSFYFWMCLFIVMPLFILVKIA
jgi:hypothetical protein